MRSPLALGEGETRFHVSIAFRGAQIAQIDRGTLVGLPLEDRGHRVCGIGLILLYFELELHFDALNHLGNGVGAVGAEQLLIVSVRGVVRHG